MNIIKCVQGSPEWLAIRNQYLCASDAPAMLGLSKYRTRTQLLHEKATGITPEVDAATQRRFDAGHRAEDLARVLVEEGLGVDLYPVTATNEIDGLQLLASFDGVTLDGAVAWENKLFNQSLCAAIENNGDLPDTHWPQVEHQLLVMGGGKVHFTVSDGTRENTVGIWYESHPERQQQLLAGWQQFEHDLAEYQHIEHIPAAAAAPTRDLPALSIQVQGSISLIDNLSVFGERLKTFVAEIDMNPSDDQGFANAEAAVKTLQAAQDALESAEASALAQTSSIDDMRKTVKLYADTARTTRLMLEKMVKARKESIRVEIVQGGKDALAEHIATLNMRLGKPYMPTIAADFAGVIKGKKNIASLHDAVATELARCKIEANAIADRIQINLTSLRELAKDHAFLFSDTSQLVMKANDDLVALIKVRIAEHQQAEAAKEEATRLRIQQEEEAKARAKVEAEQVVLSDKAEADAKAQRYLDDLENRMLAEQEAAAAIEEKRKQAQLDAQAQPFKLSGAKTVVAQAITTRPSDKDIISAISEKFGVSTGKACDWIFEVAEAMRQAA